MYGPFRAEITVYLTNDDWDEEEKAGGAATVRFALGAGVFPTEEGIERVQTAAVIAAEKAAPGKWRVMNRCEFTNAALAEMTGTYTRFAANADWDPKPAIRGTTAEEAAAGEIPGVKSLYENELKPDAEPDGDQFVADLPGPAGKVFH